MNPWEKDWSEGGFLKRIEELKNRGEDFGPAPTTDYIEITIVVFFSLVGLVIAYEMARRIIDGNKMAFRIAIAASGFWIAISLMYIFTDRYYSLDDLFWYGLVPVGGFWSFVWIIKGHFDEE